MRPTLTHIALHVANFDACLAFYLDYTQLTIVRDRRPGNKRIVWLAEPGREKEFILILLPGGPGQVQAETDFSHLGYALASKEDVGIIAAKAEKQGQLLWPCRQEPFPVGYYCGVRDPDGNAVEFSYGQPLGPGAIEE